MNTKTEGLKAGYDLQLKTPKHDELCLKYANKQNKQILIKNLPNFKISLDKQKLEFTNATNEKLTSKRDSFYEFKLLNEKLVNNDGQYSDYIETFKCIKHERSYSLKDYKDDVEIKHDWEYLVQSNNFLIGVVDFKTNFILKRKNRLIQKTQTFETGEIKSEYNRYNEHKNLFEPYDSFYANQKYKLIKTETKEIESIDQKIIYTLFSEIKPAINSIGEVMRQIKIYKSYLGLELSRGYDYSPYEKIALVTHGEQHRELFEEQNIVYINLEGVEQ